MVGTAGLPHVIVRFYTVPKVKRRPHQRPATRCVFIGILYTTAPAVAAFARTNLIHDRVNEASYQEKARPRTAPMALPGWFKKWEDTGLIAWVDKNGDGKVQYRKGAAFAGKPKFDGDKRGDLGQRMITNKQTDNANELYIDRDIMVLANPEIAQLPAWVIALVAAGGLAAALSTAAGLLLVVSTSIAHDLLKRVLMPEISEQGELMAARGAAAVAVVVAGLLGIYPPGFVAQVVAFAFGLAASSFFPIIIMGIFYKRMNREGAVAGMITGIVFTAAYIIYFKFLGGTKDQWLFGISPEGIGTVGMIINFVVAMVVAQMTPPPPQDVQDLVESIRIPKGAGGASDH